MVRRIVLDVVVTVVVALALLVVWRLTAGAAPADATAQAAQRLFLFMDIGLLAWLVMLAIAAFRGRPAGAWLTIVLATVGALLNLGTVVVVGFVQQGVWAELFIQFAIEAGFAFLVASVLAVLLVHRVILKPPPASWSRP